MGVSVRKPEVERVRGVGKVVTEVLEAAAPSGRERREDRGQTGGQWEVRGRRALVPMCAVTPGSPFQAQEDVRQQLREFEETKKQIENDEDQEIQDIKTKYKKKLRDEKESNLRLKGETGIMRKKV